MLSVLGRRQQVIVKQEEFPIAYERLGERLLFLQIGLMITKDVFYGSRLFQIGFPMAMRSLRVSSNISARIQRAVSETGKEK